MVFVTLQDVLCISSFSFSSPSPSLPLSSHQRLPKLFLSLGEQKYSHRTHSNALLEQIDKLWVLSSRVWVVFYRRKKSFLSFILCFFVSSSSHAYVRTHALNMSNVHFVRKVNKNVEILFDFCFTLGVKDGALRCPTPTPSQQIEWYFTAALAQWL